MNLPVMRAACCAVVLSLPAPVLAQRQLHWDSVEVDATLDAAGTLHVAETQTLVFSGEWNGGERRFDIRPRQRLSLLGISRLYPGGWRDLTEDGRLDEVDDYAWTDGETLRWRSRAPNDPPFTRTTIRYLLRYDMSGILQKQDTGYLLDHDFLFADREGAINRFQLRLTLDPAWQPATSMPEVYAAEQLPPGRGFIVSVPLHYSGAAVPFARDLRPPPGIVTAFGLLLLALGLGLAALFMREERIGRFAPLATGIDEAWLREHLFTYPAEVVGASWDEGISTPEVVALIARLVSEGKLESTLGKNGSMSLTLKVDRQRLSGHERTLIDKLFFGDRTQTSTTQVRLHYKTKGFNPADEIRKELQAAVDQVMPEGPKPPRLRPIIQTLFVAGLVLLAANFFVVRVEVGSALVLLFGSALLSGFAWGLGTAFRSQVHWSYRLAWVCLVPTLVAFAAAALLLWYWVRPGAIQASIYFVAAVVVLALAVLLTSIDAMLSRQSRAAVAFRKRLASARAFFMSELKKDTPALRDDWLPWLLAFGLAGRVDDWSARQGDSGRSTGGSPATTISSGSGSSSSPGWTAFSGGRSGGAGGGASWVTAASGMAAGVSTPGSSGSGSGGSSSSSSSSSSGGGGGGGW